MDPSPGMNGKRKKKLAKGDYKKSKHCVRFNGVEVKIYKLTKMVNKTFEFFFLNGCDGNSNGNNQ